MQTIISTGVMVQPPNEHSTNVFCRKRTTATQLLLRIRKRISDMLVQLNGFHTHDSDLAKKEIDKVIKDAVQTEGTSLETPKNVVGRKMKKKVLIYK